MRGPRAQADRRLYRAGHAGRDPATANLTLLEGEAADLSVKDGRVTGLVTSDGRAFACAAVIITTGTFLRGLIHRGATTVPAGRIGEAPAIRLGETLETAGFPHWVGSRPARRRDSMATPSTGVGSNGKAPTLNPNLSRF